MVYNFTDYEIDKYKTYEKGDLAESLVFTGLSVGIDRLFTGLIQGPQ